MALRDWWFPGPGQAGSSPAPHGHLPTPCPPQRRHSRWALGGDRSPLSSGTHSENSFPPQQTVPGASGLLRSHSQHQGRSLWTHSIPFTGQTHSRVQGPTKPGVPLSSTDPPNKQKVMYRGEQTPCICTDSLGLVPRPSTQITNLFLLKLRH